jgi:16S rRNA (cytidine1402-2'-O)-methyltransferase
LNQTCGVTFRFLSNPEIDRRSLDGALVRFGSGTSPAVVHQRAGLLLAQYSECHNARTMAGTLYIVSTPIGNLEDLTPRALRILREVDEIACEDTRHTRKLLNHFAIEATTISYHEHNERERADELCAMLAAGKSIALVSDAGTPIVSDPGFRVVSLAIEKGFRIVPIPGATAFVAALSASGLPSDQFLFAGFLPARVGARRAKLEEFRAIPATLIFYEAPHRIAATLRDAADILGNRHAVVARELTKLHEEFARGTLAELAENFSNRAQVRGEIVLLIAGAQSTDDIAQGLETVSRSQALAERVSTLEGEGLNEKTALKKAARELGLKRDEAYRLMLTQKNRRSK